MRPIHLTRRGNWVWCDATGETMCESIFHLRDVTPEQATQMPQPVWEQLAEVVDPPTYQMNGNKNWLCNGARHRDYDLPARISVDGGREWCQNGLQHRAGDRPAYVGPDGTLRWYMRNLRHRGHDRPAALQSDGTVVWYDHDRISRQHGPAIVELVYLAEALAAGRETYSGPQEAVPLGVSSGRSPGPSICSWRLHDEIVFGQCVNLAELLADTRRAIGELPSELANNPAYAILRAN